jgi:hypothetical protein
MFDYVTLYTQTSTSDVSGQTYRSHFQESTIPRSCFLDSLNLENETHKLIQNVGNQYQPMQRNISQERKPKHTAAKAWNL